MRRICLLAAVFLAGFGGGSGPGDFPKPENLTHPCRAEVGLPSGPDWSFIGPRSITGGQAWPGTVNVTGRVNSVVANPHNPFGEVWVATGGGGVWRFTRTVVQGVESYEWEPMTDAAESPATGVVRLDSCDAQRCRTVWVGTGENGVRRDTQYGAGVLVGRYNSQTDRYDWTQLGADMFRFGSIADLVLDPSTPDDDGKTLWVALSSGVTANAVHATVPTQPAAAYGVYKSTDAGQSWNLVLDQGAPATDLDIDPHNPNVLFAGVLRKGYWRSTNGGGTWQQIVTGIPTAYLSHSRWPELAVHRPPPPSAAVLYGVLDHAPGCPHPHESNSGGVGYCSPGIFRSVDGGNTWELREAAVEPPGGYSTPLATYATYLHELDVHPTDSNTLWYGGTQLYRSVDGGANWAKVGNFALHPDHHDLFVWEDAGSPTGISAYVVGDGGFFVGDGISTWDDGYQDGLAVTQFQSVSSSPLTDKVIGGTQDNGTNLFSGSPIWEHIDDGDAASTIMDSDDVKRMFDVYVGSPPRRCYDNGNHCSKIWPYIGNGLSSQPIAAWYPPMVEDPNPLGGQPQQHAIYFGENALFRTVDDGDSWQKISSAEGAGPDQPTYAPIKSRNVITAIAVAPSTSQRIYIGYYNGLIRRTDNSLAASPAWSSISKLPLPNRPVTSIAVHPDNPNELYVSFSGRGDHSVYMSDDAGATWVPYTQTWGGSDVLATRPANRLAIEPFPPHKIWLGTDACVYSRPAGKSSGPWIYSGHGMPTAAVYDFDIDPVAERVYAATHGRGVWSRPTSGTDSAIVKQPYEELCCAFYIDMGDPAPKFFEHLYMPLYATAFEPDASCQVTLFEGKRACVTSEFDARGAKIRTDSTGALVSDLAGLYLDRPMAWACYAGQCAGGVEAAECRPTSIALRCGRSLAEADVVRASDRLAPSSTSLRIRRVTREGPSRAAVGLLRVRPTIKLAGRSSVPLCQAELTADEQRDATELEEALARAINSSKQCQKIGVEAVVVGQESDTALEDPPAPDPRLRLVASRLQGVQLFTGVEASVGTVVVVDSMGLPLEGVGLAPRLTLGTGRDGASGGSLTVTETSPLGRCTLSITTRRGDTAEEVAGRLQQRFLSRPPIDARPRIGDPCHPRQNPRDVARQGPSLQFPLARAISVTTTDPGVNYRLDTE